MCTHDCCQSFLPGFGLSARNVVFSYRTQWKLPWILRAIYRIVIAFTYTVYAVFIFSVNDQFDTFEYLSNWTLYITAIFFIIATSNLLVDGKKGRDYNGTENRDELPQIDLTWRHKIQWIITNCFINSSLLVTIVYWAVLNGGFTTDLFWLSVNLFTHIFPSILGVIEIFMTPTPIRFQHFIHPVIYMYTYVFVTIIFYYGGNPKHVAVYSILDYANAGIATATIVGCTVFSVVLQLIMWSMYRFKLIMIGRYCTSDIEANQTLVLNVNTENTDVQEA